MDTAYFKVSGMTCGSCVASIESGLQKEDGIVDVKVSLLAERAEVKYDPNLKSPAAIADDIDDIGFGAEPIAKPTQKTMALRLFGEYDNDAVRQVLHGIEGAKITDYDEDHGKVELSIDTAFLKGPRQIVRKLEALPTDIEVIVQGIGENEHEEQMRSLAHVEETQQWKFAFRKSLIFAIPVFLLTMIFTMYDVPLFGTIVNVPVIHGIYVGDVLALGLTVPVQFGVGARFYDASLKALKHGSATMDVLVSLGTSCAFAYSVFVMLLAPFTSTQDPAYRPQVFFDTSCMLITFVTLGKWLESVAKGRTGRELSNLLNLQVQKVWLVKPDGNTEPLLNDLLEPGDVVRVLPGEKVPADGKVKSGKSTLNEAMVTGESLPIVKDAGSKVLAGTINGSGTLDIVVESAGTDTTLAQIVNLVQNAQTTKPPIQHLADRIAGVFVPCVVALALATFIAWMFIAHIAYLRSFFPKVFDEDGRMLGSASPFRACLQMCISVIVVACPCALGLSAPTAIMVGSGVGANSGILIKSSESLEDASRVKAVVFDKTGTLTMGKMSVVHVYWDREGSQSLDERLAYSLACALESKSEHPIGQAIARWVSDNYAPHSCSVSSFDAAIGQGVHALVSDGMHEYDVAAGTQEFVNCDVSSDAHAFLDKKLHANAFTPVFLAVDGRIVCIFCLQDTPRPESAGIVQALLESGIQPYMLTGDRNETARKVAETLGIPKANVRSGVSPAGKLATIRDLKPPAPGKLAFVGDGINDSPALADADVGIALSSGSDVAVEAADIVLMRMDLTDVLAALDLARTIFSRIKLNFFWAVIYNAVGIPVAMGFLLPWGIALPPMLAGAAMAFSSVSIVSFSLTLRWWRRPHERKRSALSSALSALRRRLSMRPFSTYERLPTDIEMQ